MNTFSSLTMTLNLGPQMFFKLYFFLPELSHFAWESFHLLPLSRYKVLLPLVLFLVCLRLSYNPKTAA